MTREEAIKNIKKVLPMSKTLEDAFYTLHPELYESEDERIRKAIIELLKEVGRDDTGISENAKCMIAYLEKLGEQKPVSYTPLCNTIKDKIREYVTNHFVADTVVKTDVKSIVKAMEEGVSLGREECRPAEWSGEDEDMLRDISSDLLVGTAFNIEFQTMAKKKINWLKTRLKSCRPSLSSEWSEEDSDNLERVDNYLWMLDDYVGDDCAMPQGKTDNIRGNIQGILSPWLKSLHERFNPQPKQDVLPSLSEKEIICLKRALDYLRKEHNRYGGEDFTNEIAVLEWLITHPTLVSDTH